MVVVATIAVLNTLGFATAYDPNGGGGGGNGGN